MNNKGQATGGEIALIILLVIIIGAVFFYETTKKTQVTKFEAGSQSISPAPVVHFGGCAIIKEYLYANPSDKAHNN